MTLTLFNKPKRSRTKNRNAKAKTEPPVVHRIKAAGFKPARNGTYNRDHLSLHVDADWFTIVNNKPVDDQPSNLLNHPGLWRQTGISTASLAQSQRVFDVPAYLISACEDADAHDDLNTPLEATLHWAINTADGHRNGWQAPGHGDILQSLKKTPLTIRSGGIVRETIIDHGDNHLAFRCPVLTQLPADLTEARRAWLDRLIADAQQHWRLVRFGVSAEHHALIAEVDLTGVPGVLIDSLVPVAVDALRWSVSWLAKPAAVITDLSIDSTLLATAPQRAWPEKGGDDAC